MAIDTDNEKFALIDMGDIWTDSIPISSDGLGQADKQHLLWEYPGILWAAVAVFEGVSRIMIAAAPNRTASIASSSRTFTPADD